MKLVDILARELKEWPGDFPGLTQSAVDAEIYSVEDCSDPYEYECLPNFTYTSERHTETEDYPVVTRAQWQTAVGALRSDALPQETLISDGHLPPLKSKLPMPNVMPPKQEAIDWRKAPEGATHWDASPNRTHSFMKVSEEGVYFFPPTADAESACWFPWAGKADKHFIPRPSSENTQWNGEGLPPAGVICEFEGSVSGEKTWKQCRVIAHDGQYAVINYKNNYSAHLPGSFRPIRTAEQIAVEEREKARTEVLNAMTEGGKLSDETEEQWQYRLKVVGEMLDLGYRKQVQP